MKPGQDGLHPGVLTDGPWHGAHPGIFADWGAPDDP